VSARSPIANAWIWIFPGFIVTPCAPKQRSCKATGTALSPAPAGCSSSQICLPSLRYGLALLTQAHELARATGELQRLGPIACAAAEATWLGLAPEEFGQPSAEVLQAARTPGEHWAVDELAFWTWRAFGKAALEPRDATPFSQHLRGDPRGAAQVWGALACPYERAIALLDVADATSLDDALELVEQLGATPLIQRLRRQARQSGVRSHAEPPQQSSPDLTRRQHEILLLLSEGMSNDTISKRLFLSPKTVGHHVEAILERLGARSRTEAVFLARQRGIF
jgi:DNA-binding CsgD family transcriptional regulator